MKPPAGSLDLAVIGNCQVAALVDKQGRIIWACLPKPDADPVFCALLQRDGGDSVSGVFAVDLRDMVAANRTYDRNTAIIETTLTDAKDNAVKITDFCPRFRSRGRNFRPMAIVRLLEPVKGRPIVTVRLRPRTEYGAGESQRVAGSHHIRFLSPSLNFRVTTNSSLSPLLDESAFVLDRPLAFILAVDETIEETPLTLARSWLEETRNYWHEWIRGLAVPFDWQEAVIRAAITLKLCTYEDTGALLAALTTSIPEMAGSVRNWDYRFCWLRDSFFVVLALNHLGATNTMEGYLRYIDNIVARNPGGDLQPLYSITGETKIEERIVGTLDGYRGMGPVRVGNLAYEQVQYDVYGAVVLAARQLFFDQRLTNPGDAAVFARAEVLGERAKKMFSVPDAGPWEFRGIARGAHLLIGDVLGRLRPPGPDCRARRARRSCRLLAHQRQRHARRDSRARVERNQAGIHQRVRRGGLGCHLAVAGRPGLHRGGRQAFRVHRQCHRARARARRSGISLRARR